MKICQSCGMPLEDQNLWGTEDDGRLNSEYCLYCYRDGKFTYEATMEQMVEQCIPHIINSHSDLTEHEARDMMLRILPFLKRWKTPVDRTALEKKAEVLLQYCPVIILNSVTDEGYPRGCALVKIANDGFKKIYVSTGSLSNKVTHFRKNPKAGICYTMGADGVTLIGNVRIIDDFSEKEPFWQDWMKEHFPLGAKDPSFCVLEFTTSEATFWIEKIFETYTYQVHGC